MHDVYWLTLFFDDGREATITFREVAEEIGKEASDAINNCVAASGAKVESSAVNPFLATLKTHSEGTASQSGMMPFAGMQAGISPFSGIQQATSMLINQQMVQMGQGFQNQSDVVYPSGANASAGVSGSNDTWDCKCGAKGLTGKFCPECGGPKG